MLAKPTASPLAPVSRTASSEFAWDSIGFDLNLTGSDGFAVFKTPTSPMKARRLVDQSIPSPAIAATRHFRDASAGPVELSSWALPAWFRPPVPGSQDARTRKLGASLGLASAARLGKEAANTAATGDAQPFAFPTRMSDMLGKAGKALAPAAPAAAAAENNGLLDEDFMQVPDLDGLDGLFGFNNASPRVSPKVTGQSVSSSADTSPMFQALPEPSFALRARSSSPEIATAPAASAPVARRVKKNRKRKARRRKNTKTRLPYGDMAKEEFEAKMGKIPVYTPGTRGRVLDRYRLKRARSLMRKKKTIRYAVRQVFANSRLRIGGRFATAEQIAKLPADKVAALRKAQGVPEPKPAAIALN